MYGNLLIYFTCKCKALIWYFKTSKVLYYFAILFFFFVTVGESRQSLLSKFSEEFIF